MLENDEKHMYGFAQSSIIINLQCYKTEKQQICTNWEAGTG